MKAWEHLAPWAAVHNPTAHEFCSKAIGSGDRKTSVAGLRRLVEVVVEAGDVAALAPAIDDGSLEGFEVKGDGMVIGRQVSWKSWLAIERGRVGMKDLALILVMLGKGWRLTEVGTAPTKGIPDEPRPGKEIAEQVHQVPQGAQALRGQGVVDKAKPGVQKRGPRSVDLSQRSLLSS